MANIYVVLGTDPTKKITGKRYDNFRKLLGYNAQTSKIWMLNLPDKLAYWESNWSDEDGKLRDNIIRKYSRYAKPKINKSDKLIVVTKTTYLNRYDLDCLHEHMALLKQATKYISYHTMPYKQEVKQPINSDIYSVPEKITSKIPLGNGKFKVVTKTVWADNRLLVATEHPIEDLIDTIKDLTIKECEDDKFSTSPQPVLKTLSDEELSERINLYRGLKMVDALPTYGNLLPKFDAVDSIRIAEEFHETKTSATGELWKKPTSGYSILSKKGIIDNIDEDVEYWNEVVANKLLQVLNPNITYCKVCGKAKLLNSECPRCHTWTFMELIDYHKHNPSRPISYEYFLELVHEHYGGIEEINKKALRLIRQICTIGDDEAYDENKLDSNPNDEDWELDEYERIEL